MVMDKEKKQMYSARVSQANASELVVITYEIIEDCIVEAKEELTKGEKEKFSFVIFEQEVGRARKLLNELMGSLDYSYKISLELLNLYRYADRQLSEALFQKKKEPLDNANKVLATLKKGFVEVAKQDTRGPVMENTQQVYAGLTYGRNALNEVLVNANESSRGFRA
jgi:flagellar protein FliS